jgi:DNA-binding transcriptional LysR family regulator
VAATGVTPSVEWKFARGRAVRLRPRLTVTSNEAAIEAVRAGFGVSRLMSYQVASLVAAGELRVVMEDFEMPPLPIHVLHREGRHKSARVRTLVDLMVERLRGVNSPI